MYHLDPDATHMTLRRQRWSSRLIPFQQGTVGREDRRGARRPSWTTVMGWEKPPLNLAASTQWSREHRQ